MIKIYDDGLQLVVDNTLTKQTLQVTTHHEYKWIRSSKGFRFNKATCSIEYYRARDYCIEGNKLILYYSQDLVVVCEFKTKIKWFNKIGAG